MAVGSWGRTTRVVARLLVRSAIERNVVPGDHLASESALIEDTGVSRATVREALRLLGFLGATRSTFGPHGGTIVGLPNGTAVASSLTLALQGRRATFQTVLDAQAAFLPMAAAQAARRRTVKDIDALHTTAANVVAAPDPQSLTEALHRFNATLAAATHNDAIELQVQALIRILMTASIEVSTRTQVVISRHLVAAVDAIKARDAASASAELERAATRWRTTLERGQAQPLAAWITWPDIDADLEDQGELV